MRNACLAFLVFLCGCATSHVLIGEKRPAISPDLVKIYYHPPAKYDEIALLDTSSKLGFGITAQGKTDVVIKRLKEDAAKLGANGVLLGGVGNESQGSVSTGFGSATSNGNSTFGSGVGVTSNITGKAANGVAIYVPPN